MWFTLSYFWYTLSIQNNSNSNDIRKRRNTLYCSMRFRKVYWRFTAAEFGREGKYTERTPRIAIPSFSTPSHSNEQILSLSLFLCCTYSLHIYIYIYIYIYTHTHTYTDIYLFLLLSFFFLIPLLLSISYSLSTYNVQKYSICLFKI